MPARPSKYKFGTFVVRVSECLFLTEEPCVPPSCNFLSICSPPSRTAARVAYIPRQTDPADFKQLLQQIERLKLEIEVVVPRDPDSPLGAVETLQRDLGQ